MNALHARLIADYCNRNELEVMLMDDRLAYFAMHEAEKALNFNDLRDMEESVIFHFGVFPFSATASHRAEAFLRTLNLWEESE